MSLFTIGDDMIMVMDKSCLTGGMHTSASNLSGVIIDSDMGGVLLTVGVSNRRV